MFISQVISKMCFVFYAYAFDDVMTSEYLKVNIWLSPEQKGICNSRVKIPSYGLWRHKTELSQIVTS